MNKLKRFLKLLGPGLTTGAADDDPSGIATYSQAGAQFGYGMLWSVIFAFPLMVAVQEASARIGAVTGQGLASVIKKHYGKNFLFGFVGLLFVANIINIGADIGAMAAAVRLFVPLDFYLVAATFAILIVVAEIFISYKSYSRILKWLSLALLAYILTIFVVTNSWSEIIKSTFIPHIQFNFAYLFIITGVFGTTISPYLFFWEASQEVEEELEHKSKATIGSIKNLRIDNFLGMLSSQITTWAIIVVAASVLNKNGITNIATSADAARALVPLVNSFPNAGIIAEAIFAIGILGLGFLAVPILAGSLAFAISETFNLKEGLEYKLFQAKKFYAVIAIATFLGFLINFFGIDPIKLLVWSSVVNGFVAVPLIFVIGKIASNKKIMGEFVSGNLSKIFNSMAFIVMTIVAVGVVATFLVK